MNDSQNQLSQSNLLIGGKKPPKQPTTKTHSKTVSMNAAERN